MYSFSRIRNFWNQIIQRDPLVWRRFRQECARISANLFGDFPISEDHKLWRRDVEFISEYKKLSPENSYSEDRKFTLREFVRSVQDVPGEMAECGCFQGCSTFFIAKQNPSVLLHVFDSFEGLSLPAVEDSIAGLGKSAWRKGEFKSNEVELRNNLKGLDNIVIHKGWIPQRFPEIADRNFRFVHIDVDLYQPVLESMKFFYPRMTRRGVLVLDDYGFETCPGAYRAVTEFMSDKPEYVIHLTTGQGIVIKQ